MSDVVEIFNLSLSMCGVSIAVATEAENSREAALCRLWYPRVRDNVLGSAPWPSVRGIASLTQFAARDFAQDWTAEDPAPEYAYAYTPPADMIRPYFLESYMRFEYRLLGSVSALEGTPKPYISTNAKPAILHYNRRTVTPSLWSTDLHMAVVHTLATFLAIPLTGSRERLSDNANLAFEYVEAARTAAANASYQKEETLPTWVSDRGYSNTLAPRYYYPYDTLAVGASS